MINCFHRMILCHFWQYRTLSLCAVVLVVCVCVRVWDTWEDCVPNTVVLEKCGTTGIEAHILQVQFHWVGHVVRMEDYRIPKQVFFGQLAAGKRLAGGPLQRYKDSLKVNLRRCSLDPKLLCLDAQHWSGWRSTCRAAVAEFEAARIEALQDKRALRKQAVHTGAWACSSCPRICSSRIGLFAHMKIHPK